MYSWNPAIIVVGAKRAYLENGANILDLFVQDSFYFKSVMVIRFFSRKRILYIFPEDLILH